MEGLSSLLESAGTGDERAGGVSPTEPIGQPAGETPGSTFLGTPRSFWT